MFKKYEATFVARNMMNKWSNFLEIFEAGTDINLIARARLDFRRQINLCATLYRNALEESNFGINICTFPLIFQAFFTQDALTSSIPHHFSRNYRCYGFHKHTNGKVLSRRGLSWKTAWQSSPYGKVITLWMRPRAGVCGAFQDKSWSFLVLGEAMKPVFFFFDSIAKLFDNTSCTNWKLLRVMIAIEQLRLWPASPASRPIDP